MRNFSLAAAAVLALALAAPARPAEASKPVTLKGQVVCSSCWFEEDRAKVPYGSPADLQCAADCAKKGIGPALAVRFGNAYELYLLDGQAPEGGWLAATGKSVEATGTTGVADGKKQLHVDKMRLVAAKPAKGDPAAPPPELALEDLAGAKQKLDQFRGKVVVLNFWATWCMPCRAEMPILVDLQASHGPRGVQVLGAAADGRDSAPAINKFAKDVKMNFPIWVGANASDMRAFGVMNAVPATVILDRNGSVVWRKEGMIEAKELREQVERLLVAPKV